jgi:hypothetical protein
MDLIESTELVRPERLDLVELKCRGLSIQQRSNLAAPHDPQVLSFDRRNLRGSDGANLGGQYRNDLF